MRKVYVCGSFRFKREMEELEHILEKEDIEHQIAKTKNNRGILGCLKKIDDSNIIYIVNPGGYVGNSVCVDIGYAYAKNKPIYALNELGDPPLMSLLQGTLSFEELINLLK
jgi:nucleoside 2-deoxyribosyltransferase